MATINVSNGRLHLLLTRSEKVSGLIRDVSVPLESITGIRMVDNAMAAVRGLRSPGLSVPGKTRIGTWRGQGHRSLVVARRGQPALVLALAGHKYTELIVSVPDADQRLAALGDHLSSESSDSFTEEESTFLSGSLRLAGTLTMPVGPAIAVALLVPGSGEVDRDANHRRLPLGVSRDFAHALAARGIASFRYDKRGIGQSEGSYLRAGLHDNHSDAEAALGFVQTNAGTAELPTFVIGHSEGGIIAELLAAEHRELSGTVLLAAPARSGAETMAWQTKQIANALPPLARFVVRLLRVDLKKQQQKAVAQLRATTEDVARIQGKKVNARWQRELLDFQPRPILARIETPVLAITGGKDLQVDPDDLEIIQDTVLGSVDIARPADLTHLLRRDANPANLGAYKQLVRKATDPNLISLVVAWIRTRATIPA